MTQQKHKIEMEGYTCYRAESHPNKKIHNWVPKRDEVPEVCPLCHRKDWYISPQEFEGKMRKRMRA